MRRASGAGSTLSSRAEAPSAMPCCSCTRTAQRRPTTTTRSATVAELAAAFVALEGASSRNDRAGPRLHRGDARRMAMRGARSVRCGVGRAGRLSGRRRCRGCRPRHRARARALRLPARRRREPHLGGRAAHSARADRRAAPAGGAGAGRSPRPPRARSQRRSIRLGGAAFRADIASMRHETQYTRLFRS